MWWIAALGAGLGLGWLFFGRQEAAEAPSRPPSVPVPTPGKAEPEAPPPVPEPPPMPEPGPTVAPPGVVGTPYLPEPEAYEAEYAETLEAGPPPPPGTGQAPTWEEIPRRIGERSLILQIPTAADRVRVNTIRGYAAIELWPHPRDTATLEPTGDPGWMAASRPLYLWSFRYTAGTTPGTVLRIVFFRGDQPVAEYARLVAI